MADRHSSSTALAQVLVASNKLFQRPPGISAAEHVASLRGIADAVVVGSAALDAVSAAPADRRPAALRQFVAMLAAAGKD